MESELLMLAAVCFVAMVSPGPDFIVVSKNSLVHSRFAALATAAGIVAGCMVHATYCILGLAVLITQSVLLFRTVRYAGACYLIYLGIKALMGSAGPMIRSEGQRGGALSVTRAFSEGFLCNLLNPKLAVFLLSLFTQFVSVEASVGEKALVAGIFVGESALYWPTLALILQVRSVRAFFLRAEKALDRVFGVILVGFGVRVALARD